ncbi:MAG: NAD-dependent epimerase/dehydratase family protein [Lachnospiraceae bacterium]|nr:NAD-dependent epimerase/dehydratase family protein [Lachnospiraceae bacterium]
MKFLVLGCNGMAGHTIGLYLKERGNKVDGFARRENPLFSTHVGDARDLSYLQEIIVNGKYTAVINCIGILNAFAENDHEAATFLNSYLPHFLEKITSNTDTRVIHISTDCVFSGKRGNYSEMDFPDGETFYDRSKALGELINDKDLTIRSSIIGPDLNPNGIGLFNWFMQQDGPIKGFSRAIWTGQTTLQLAKSIEEAIHQDAHGLYNLVPNTSINKYELLCLLNKYFRNNAVEIVPDDNFVVDKSLVRKNFSLLDYTVPDYEQQVVELFDWVLRYKSLYNHYKL